MLTIRTSKGKTYNVQYAWAPRMDGSCGISLPDDNRKLSVIAREFEGLESIHLTDTEAGEYDFEGYTELAEISRAGRLVNMKLVKG